MKRLFAENCAVFSFHGTVNYLAAKHHFFDRLHTLHNFGDLKIILRDERFRYCGERSS